MNALATLCATMLIFSAFTTPSVIEPHWFRCRLVKTS